MLNRLLGFWIPTEVGSTKIRLSFNYFSLTDFLQCFTIGCLKNPCKPLDQMTRESTGNICFPQLYANLRDEFVLDFIIFHLQRSDSIPQKGSF